MTSGAGISTGEMIENAYKSTGSIEAATAKLKADGMLIGYTSVRKYLRKQGLLNTSIMDRKGTPITEEQRNFILENYETKTITYMMAQTKLTEIAIRRVIDKNESGKIASTLDERKARAKKNSAVVNFDERGYQDGFSMYRDMIRASEQVAGRVDK